MYKLFAVAAFAIAIPSLAAASQLKTQANLQTAFDGESNAHARYLAFADKAQQEGFGPVASLFQAAAKAEEIHAANHAVVIRQLGAVPQAKIATPDVKTTRENILAALKGETYERDVMYPEFLKVARAENQTNAIRTFSYAKTAEAEHAKLYAATAEKLETMRGDAVTYYVCTVCGYTTAKIDFEKCPACFNPKEKYIAVS